MFGVGRRILKQIHFLVKWNELPEVIDIGTTCKKDVPSVRNSNPSIKVSNWRDAATSVVKVVCRAGGEESSPWSESGMGWVRGCERGAAIYAHITKWGCTVIPDAAFISVISDNQKTENLFISLNLYCGKGVF